MNLLRDLGYGLRQIARRPLFSLAIILTLGIGIGPNVAIFSVLKALMFEQLPYFEPTRLVQVWQTDIDGRWRQPFSWPDFRDIREQSESFEAFGVQNPRTFNLGGDEPVRVQGMMVTADALTVWGVPPAHGRLFTEEEVEGEERLAVLSDSVWRRSYDGDPAIVGESISANGDSYQVVGVMPPDFEYYTPWTEGREVDLWVPMQLREGANRQSHWLLAVARLKPGISWKTAEAEIRGIAARLQKDYPESNARTQVWILPFLIQVVGGISGQVAVLIVAVGFVLLSACANVAGMLLARGSDRRTEVAIRGSLGAGRRRILTQLLTESGLLSLIGGGVGVLLAVWSLGLLKSIMPPEVPRTHGIEIDSLVLVFALVLTLLTGFLFGLVPALAAARTDIASTLREGAGTATATKRRNRTLRLLAVAQIAVAFFLTNCAILLYTSYKAVLDIPFHFDTENVIAARIATSGERYDNDEKKTLFWEQVIERVEVLPGVERAAVTTKLPLEGGNNSSILVAGETYDPQVRRPLVERSYVSPGYFEAMGIPLLAGSVFEAEDGTAERRVIVVNQELADRYFPDADAVGQVIRQNEAEPEWTATIVGVVANVRQWGPLYGALPEWYTPYRLNPYGDSHLVVRSAKAPSSLLPAIQKEVLQIDKDLPLSQPRTMGQVIAEATEGRRFLFTLVGLFAVLSMILAMAGIFGTVSHNVAQRTREIGVRVAFGAHRWRILRLVLRQGLIMSGVGIGTGVLLVLVFYSGLRSLFYGISPLQPTLAGFAILLLFVVTLVATVLPAFRAVRVDPMQALRFE